MRIFRGLSAFPITPADEAGRVDADGLARLLHRLEAARVDSIGLLGSTGSYAYLSRQERRRAVEVATQCVGGRIPIIVGIGALRTDDAQELARDAEAAGAHGLLLAPVSYTPLTEEEVYRHFAAVAASTDLPLCIYNNPSTTHFLFTDALIGRLAAVTTIVAVKNPAPPAAEARTGIAALKRLVPADFAIGHSADWLAPDAVLAGGVAWYSVLAGLLPLPCLALMRAAQAGDVAEVRRLDAGLEPLWILFRRHGSLRVVHAAANLLGLTDASPPLPILPLGSGERDQVAHALEQAQRLPPAPDCCNNWILKAPP